MYTTKTNNKHHKDYFPQIDRVLGEIFNTNFNHLLDENKVGYTHPAANVHEHKEKFVIALAVPGLAKEDVKIKVDKKVLTISADKDGEQEVKFKVKEFMYGKFSRKFKLPNAADVDAISAEMNNGVLSITIGKKKEEIDNGPKDIQVS